MANIVEGLKGFFRSAKPAARLAELTAAIEAAEAERAQHVARRPAEVVAKLTGDPDAAARVDMIDREAAALDARLRDLREGADELRRRIAADAAIARRRAVEERPKRVAEFRRSYISAVERVAQLGEELATALRDLSAAADALAAELDDETARRFLAFGPRLHRMQSGLARLFVIDPARGLTGENSLIGMPSHEIGVRSHLTPTQHEEMGLDDLAPFFDHQADAEAARDRLAARGSKVIVLPLPGGCFTLVPPEHLFGERAAAERAAADAAARGRRLTILPHEGGFVLSPERFTQGAV